MLSLWQNPEFRARMVAKRKTQHNPRRGSHLSEEQRAVLREAHTGERMSDAARAKMSISHTGKPLSTATREKMSAIRKGKHVNQPHTAAATEKRRLAQVGRHHRAETLVKLGHISTARWNDPAYRENNVMSRPRGNRHYNWQGGASRRLYPSDWTKALRQSIRRRDCFACQVCGVHQSKAPLHVHHVDRDKTNGDPRNLVSLCCSCHATIHLRYEKFWMEFFVELSRRRMALPAPEGVVSVQARLSPSPDDNAERSISA